MASTTDKDSLIALLEPFGQQHVLAFWDQLPRNEQETLAGQIARLNLPQIERLVRQQDSDTDWAAIAAAAVAPPAVRPGDPDFARRRTDAVEAGRVSLAAGEVGVVLVAGGQGTRLGFEHPKGMYPIGPVSRHSLFQIHFEKVAATAARYGCRIPLLIMTSPATDDETRAYLQAERYFGLDPSDVLVFCQGTMPAVDRRTGKLLLTGRGQLALSPDGHGGMLAALEASQALSQLQRRGIRRLFYFQVDNPLAPVCDPAFIGHHLAAESELTSLAVEKRDPLERVGNFAAIDGSVRVIEYSDLPAAIAQRRDADGNLVLWAGSIAVHLFELDFLQRMIERDDSLPFHIAKKKVPHTAADGRTVAPAKPNALKFERFIFDLLPHARNALVVEGEAAEVFAPLKSEAGAASDTEAHVHQAMIALHRQWIEAAGGTVADNVAVEISPRYALDAGQVREKLQSGAKFTEETFLT